MESEYDIQQDDETSPSVMSDAGERRWEEVAGSDRRPNDWPFNPPRPVTDAEI